MISKELLHDKWFWTRTHPEEINFYIPCDLLEDREDSDIVKIQ